LILAATAQLMAQDQRAQQIDRRVLQRAPAVATDDEFLERLVEVENAMNLALAGVQSDMVDWANRVNDTNTKKKELREDIAEIREAMGNYPVTVTVEGQPVEITTKEQAESLLSNLEEKMQTYGDDAQMRQLMLQDMLQKQTQMFTMMTNLLKVWHEAQMAIIRNLK
jgi:hypothetical protein